MTLLNLLNIYGGKMLAQDIFKAFENDAEAFENSFKNLKNKSG